jgi:hypothetical protein
MNNTIAPEKAPRSISAALSALVEDWSDERSSGDYIYVTLNWGLRWDETDGDHMKSFETVSEAREALKTEVSICYCKACLKYVVGGAK